MIEVLTRMKGVMTGVLSQL